MAGSGKRGGGERVLESRHLVGLFLGVVLLCGVFFTLGYVMGRNQFGGSVHAESAIRNTPSSLAKSKGAEQPAPAPDWDFYDKNKDTSHLEPPAAAVKSPPVSAPVKPAANTSAPVAAAKPSANDAKAAHPQQPAIPKSGILLQVAAVRSQSDALEMAEAIQQKRFPCFVVTPTSDNYYRIQVGPYPDIASAEAAKRSLEQLGFKNIFRR
jgi:cell division septation protein DedD